MSKTQKKRRAPRASGEKKEIATRGDNRKKIVTSTDMLRAFESAANACSAPSAFSAAFGLGLVASTGERDLSDKELSAARVIARFGAYNHAPGRKAAIERKMQRALEVILAQLPSSVTRATPR
jgi:hypothetical protein